jgi:hypothetical protein
MIMNKADYVHKEYERLILRDRIRELESVLRWYALLDIELGHRARLALAGEDIMIDHTQTFKSIYTKAQLIKDLDRMNNLLNGLLEGSYAYNATIETIGYIRNAIKKYEEEETINGS